MFCLDGSISWRRIHLIVVRTPTLWKPSAIMHSIPWFSQQHYGGGQWAVRQTLSLPSWAQIKSKFPSSLCSLCCVTWNVSGGDVCSLSLFHCLQPEVYANSFLVAGLWGWQGLHPDVQPGSVDKGTKRPLPLPSMDWLDFTLARNTVLNCLAKPPRS